MLLARIRIRYWLLRPDENNRQRSRPQGFSAPNSSALRLLGLVPGTRQAAGGP